MYSQDTSKKFSRTKKEAAKFNPPGISLKGKFIGIENIDNNCSIDKYDLICQVAMARMKAAVKVLGKHKKKIIINISILGLHLFEEGSSQHSLQLDHPLQQIIYVTRDVTDHRAFGYIYNNVDEERTQFYGVKTEKSADYVVNLLKELFSSVKLQPLNNHSPSQHKTAQRDISMSSRRKQNTVFQSFNSTTSDNTSYLTRTMSPKKRFIRIGRTLQTSTPTIHPHNNNHFNQDVFNRNNSFPIRNNNNSVRKNSNNDSSTSNKETSVQKSSTSNSQKIFENKHKKNNDITKDVNGGGACDVNRNVTKNSSTNQHSFNNKSLSTSSISSSSSSSTNNKNKINDNNNNKDGDLFPKVTPKIFKKFYSLPSPLQNKSCKRADDLPKTNDDVKNKKENDVFEQKVQAKGLNTQVSRLAPTAVLEEFEREEESSEESLSLSNNNNISNNNNNVNNSINNNINNGVNDKNLENNDNGVTNSDSMKGKNSPRDTVSHEAESGGEVGGESGHVTNKVCDVSSKELEFIDGMKVGDDENWATFDDVQDNNGMTEERNTMEFLKQSEPGRSENSPKNKPSLFGGRKDQVERVDEEEGGVKVWGDQPDEVESASWGKKNRVAVPWGGQLSFCGVDPFENDPFFTSSEAAFDGAFNDSIKHDDCWEEAPQRSLGESIREERLVFNFVTDEASGLEGRAQHTDEWVQCEDVVGEESILGAQAASNPATKPACLFLKDVFNDSKNLSDTTPGSLSSPCFSSCHSEFPSPNIPPPPLPPSLTSIKSTPPPLPPRKNLKDQHDFDSNKVPNGDVLPIDDDSDVVKEPVYCNLKDFEKMVKKKKRKEAKSDLNDNVADVNLGEVPNLKTSEKEDTSCHLEDTKDANTIITITTTPTAITPSNPITTTNPTTAITTAFNNKNNDETEAQTNKNKDVYNSFIMLS